MHDIILTGTDQTCRSPVVSPVGIRSDLQKKMEDKDLICHTGVPGSVQRHGQDGVQAQLIPGQGRGNGGAKAHPLYGWKH